MTLALQRGLTTSPALFDAHGRNDISKIETVDAEQGTLARMFGYGTVLIRGTSAGFEPLDQVSDPLALRNAILVG